MIKMKRVIVAVAAIDNAYNIVYMLHQTYIKGFSMFLLLTELFTSYI